ncbi:MAG: alpha/beta hydrolase [Sandaracinaceae bacterium]|nr:alpha/beta hydrolase [Sandaracinaceae bacterium]
MRDLEQRVEEKRVRSFDGAEIAYHVVGSGPPIVLVNGLGGSWRAWSHQIRRFSGEFRFISWDYRGMYQSPIPRDRDELAVGRHALDGLAVLAAEGITRCEAFGWSMGVQVSLEMFRAAPHLFTSLVLVNGVAGSPFKTLAGSAAVGGLAPPLLRRMQDVPRLVAAVTRHAVHWPGTVDLAVKLGIASSTIDREVFGVLARSFSGLDMRVYARMLEQLGDHDAHDVLRRIEVPVLMIAGGRDLMTPRIAAERIVRGVQRGELFVVPEGTHYIAVEYPALLNERIDRFHRDHGLFPRTEVLA